MAKKLIEIGHMEVGDVFHRNNQWFVKSAEKNRRYHPCYCTCTNKMVSIRSNEVYQVYNKLDVLMNSVHL